MKLTGKAGQVGASSLLELALVVALIGLITAFVVQRADQQRQTINDSLAKTTVESTAASVRDCWQTYNTNRKDDVGATLEVSTSGVESVVCTRNGESTVTVATVPEGIHVAVEASNGRITQLGAYSEDGTSKSDAERTVFCMDADGSINAVVAADGSTCPAISRR